MVEPTVTLEIPESWEVTLLLSLDRDNENDQKLAQQYLDRYPGLKVFRDLSHAACGCGREHCWVTTYAGTLTSWLSMKGHKAYWKALEGKPTTNEGLQEAFKEATEAEENRGAQFKIADSLREMIDTARAVIMKEEGTLQ